jgi:hypothetical protein
MCVVELKSHVLFLAVHGGWSVSGDCPSFAKRYDDKTTLQTESYASKTYVSFLRYKGEGNTQSVLQEGSVSQFLPSFSLECGTQYFFSCVFYLEF